MRTMLLFEKSWPAFLTPFQLVESLWRLLFMPSGVGNVLRSGDWVVRGSRSTRRLQGGHCCFVPRGSKVTPQVIHNPTAFSNNYFYILSHKNTVSL